MADILTYLSLGSFAFSLVVWLPSCMGGDGPQPTSRRIIGGRRDPME